MIFLSILLRPRSYVSYFGLRVQIYRMHCSKLHRLCSLRGNSNILTSSFWYHSTKNFTSSKTLIFSWKSLPDLLNYIRVTVTRIVNQDCPSEKVRSCPHESSTYVATPSFQLWLKRGGMTKSFQLTTDQFSLISKSSHTIPRAFSTFHPKLCTSVVFSNLWSLRTAFVCEDWGQCQMSGVQCTRKPLGFSQNFSWKL